MRELGAVPMPQTQLPDLGHEIPIPNHATFGAASDQAVAQWPWLIVSGPSRMGNHLLLSLLDGHPNLPSVPGEDGALSFAFAAAANDPDGFFERLGREANSALLRRYAANGHLDKWSEYAKAWRAGAVNDKPAGVGTTDVPAIFDYRFGAPAIDFSHFVAALDKGYATTLQSRSFANLIVYYVAALTQLLASNEEKVDLRFKGLICHSGMRSQCLWALDRFTEVRVLASLRPFESYAWSHIRSRHGRTDMTTEVLDEAWSHWRNKLADYIAIKRAFPDRVVLVSYQDLVEKTESTMAALTKFLGLPMASICCRPTVDGEPVGGNASDANSADGGAAIYKATTGALPEAIGAEAEVIWADAYDDFLKPAGS